MSFFSDHGTKILGAMSAMTGAAQMGLPSLESGNVLSTAHALLWGFFLGVMTAGLGGATVVRGFSNTRSQSGDTK